MMYVAPLDLAREYNYILIEELLLRRGSIDVDHTNARWDDLWDTLEMAVAAGQLGGSHGPFNASEVRHDFAALQATLDQMKNESGPHGEFLRWAEEHSRLVSGSFCCFPL